CIYSASFCFFNFFFFLFFLFFSHFLLHFLHLFHHLLHISATAHNFVLLISIIIIIENYFLSYLLYIPLKSMSCITHLLHEQYLRRIFVELSYQYALLLCSLVLVLF